MNGILETPKDAVDDSYTAMSNTTSKINIGRYSYSNNMAYNGLIDEVRIYNRALSS